MPTLSSAAPSSDRLIGFDVLRGMALFGVLAVNVLGEFRISIFQQFLPRVDPPFWLDHFVEAAVYFAIEMKAFALFSMLFGLGLAVQFERLSRRGRPYHWLLRRLGVLLVFGLVHLCFVWNGDILTEYALTGLLVLPFLGAPTSALLAACVAFLALYLCLPMMRLPIGLPDVPALQAHVAEANQIYANGGLAAVWRFSVAELPLLLQLHLWVLPRTVALFLLGMLVWRARAGCWRRSRRSAAWRSAITSRSRWCSATCFSATASVISASWARRRRSDWALPSIWGRWP